MGNSVVLINFCDLWCDSRYNMMKRGDKVLSAFHWCVKFGKLQKPLPNLAQYRNMFRKNCQKYLEIPKTIEMIIFQARCKL